MSVILVGNGICTTVPSYLSTGLGTCAADGDRMSIRPFRTAIASVAAGEFIVQGGNLRPTGWDRGVEHGDKISTPGLAGRRYTAISVDHIDVFRAVGNRRDAGPNLCISGVTALLDPVGERRLRVAVAEADVIAVRLHFTGGNDRRK
ncbi:MAG: hypothetical protein UX00_C0006G0027 [Microgenomates group bacterium GW2011_GWB1_45_17]|nr:MAG: hypothetical protein UX00_C0006G0027 [Microgenomates group bacterium GW2011_GWB1_45_17]